MFQFRRKNLKSKVAVFLLILSASFDASAIVLDPDEMNMSDVYQQKANIAVAKIQAAMRFQLSVPAIVQNSKRNVDTPIQDALRRLPIDVYAMTVSAFVNVNSIWSSNEEQPISKCLIVIATNGFLAPPIIRDSMMIHEVFHCFQFDIARSSSEVVRRAPWVVEGTAMFVGEDLIPQSTQLGDSRFRQYTRSIQNIFDRSYDAYPFFLHLKLEGEPVYNLFQRFFVGGHDNNKLWQDVVTTVSHKSLMTWAASFAHKPEWGRDWDLKTRDFYPPASDIAPFPFTNVYTATLPLEAPGVMGLPRHDKVFLEPNKIVKISVENGVAALFYRTASDPNGRTFYLQENQSVQFCSGPECDCPEFMGSVHTIKVNNPEVFVASVSTRANHTIHFDEGVKNCCSNEGAFDSRMIGTWKSSTARFLEIWGNYPYSGGVKENTGSGEIEFIIGRHGEIIKKYQDVHFNSTVTKGNNVSSLDFRINYEVAGCLTTRAINESQGWLYITDMIDQVEWVTQTQSGRNHPVITKHATGEWYQSSLCAGAGTVDHPCSGTFYFEDNKLRFNGGVGNEVYNDLVRVQ